MPHKISLAQIDAAVKAGNISEASRLVQLGVSQKMDFEGRHVFYANVLFASMPWREVSALLPSGTNSFQTTGWINSVLKGRPLDGHNNPIPWFTYPAIDFLESILDPHWIIPGSIRFDYNQIRTLLFGNSRQHIMNIVFPRRHG